MPRIFNKTTICSLAAAAFLGVGATMMFLAGGTTAASAANAQWCLDKDGSYDCAYITMSQCLASASGQGGQCNPNGRYYDSAYAQAPRIIR
jgi:hypothetical protein